MLEFLESFFADYGYAAVFTVLIICGFGIPIPEDVTLVAGGVISGLGQTNVHIMVAVGLAGVLVGDGLMFMAGRLWGERILRVRFIARIMTPKRYNQVQLKFQRYGNRVLFVARFLPGLRTPIFLTAGISRKVSVWQFLAMDGLAALISVPVWVYLGAYSAENREWLMQQVHHFQYVLFAAIALVASYIGYRIWKRRTRFQELLAKRKARRLERKAQKQNKQ